jgi:hypothetical protein
LGTSQEGGNIGSVCCWILEILGIEAVGKDFDFGLKLGLDFGGSTVEALGNVAAFVGNVGEVSGAFGSGAVGGAQELEVCLGVVVGGIGDFGDFAKEGMGFFGKVELAVEGCNACSAAPVGRRLRWLLVDFHELEWVLRNSETEHVEEG